MSISGTSPAAISSVELARARRSYFAYGILNSIAFKLVAGSIITLYALDLGAGNTLVGLLESFGHVSLLFLLVGRLLARRMGAVRVMSRFWALRFLMILPAVITALPAVRTNTALALTLLAISVFGFHAAKGTAMASQNPILGLVAGVRDRGAFLSRVQMLDQPFSILTWLLVGFALGREAPPQTYGIFFALGIIVGLGSAWQVSRLPEPPRPAASASAAFLPRVLQALGSRPFRRLIGLTFFKNVVLAMTGPFLIVFFKRVYQHTDASMVYLTLASNLGVLLMAGLSGLLMDRVGAKPLYFAFAVATAAILIPLFAGRPRDDGILYWLVPAAAFLVYSLGANGMGNCSQHYFFVTVKPDERLNLGVVFNISAGLAGFVGSLGGGALLDLMESSLGLTPSGTFRLYFAGLFVLMFGVALLVYRLPGLGSYSISTTLSILFSPQDLRAVALLQRLDRSQTPEEEQDTLRALAENPSELSIAQLLQHLRSPSFSVRTEALRSLRNMPPSLAITEALITEVEEHEFTTAHMAAEILGDRRCREASAALRQALRSEDFMLCGKAMVALAQIGDRASFDEIRRTFAASANPRVLIHGAKALAHYGDPRVVADLLERLESDTAPLVRDEIVLAVADLLGMGDWFYRRYVAFLDSEANGVLELRGVLEHPGDDHEALLASFGEGGSRFAEAAARLLGLAPLLAHRPRGAAVDVAPMLAAALRKANLADLPRLRFLIAAAIVWRDADGGRRPEAAPDRP